jgi:isoquinoline 1-oxidoreductase beta subunit
MTTDSSADFSVAPLSRRSFIVQSALASCGITFVVAGCSGSGADHQLGAPSGDKQASLTTNSWVTLHGDGTIEIVSPAVELGQGAMTALALFVAEELDADWQQVRVLAAPADEKRYGNPLFWGLQMTAGSRTTVGYFDVLRLAGAQARHVLLTAAAGSWGVPVDELTTESSVVRHARSGRRATYGELVAIAQVPATFPEFVAADYQPQPADVFFGEPPPSPIEPGANKKGALSLKRRAEYRLIGVDVPRVDIPQKVNGTVRYGIDEQIPDMLYAMVETGPSSGDTAGAVDSAAALAVPGVLEVITLPHGVAVVGTTIFAVRDARRKLKISWNGAGQSRDYDSDATLEGFSRIAAAGKSGKQVFMQGDPKELATALTGIRPEGVRRFAFQIRSELVYHAPLEPQNATVRVAADGMSAEIWVGTQWPTAEATEVAAILGIKPENVKVNMRIIGGAFGRRCLPGASLDAAQIAQHMRGKPVKVIWTREDDLKRNPHRQALVCRVEVAVSDAGAFLAMRNRVVADSLMARADPDLFKEFHNTDPGNWMGACHLYDVPHQVVEDWFEKRAVDVSYMRGIGVVQVKFCQECLIDQVAKELHQDPLRLRLKLLHAVPRGVAVLEEVARMSQWDQWDRKRTDRALGVTFMSYAGAHGALVAEVSVDRSTGVIKVHKVWTAVDVGLVVLPGAVVAQLEGGIIQGMSMALHERVTVKKGVTQESNFHDYPIIRMSEVPEVEVKLIPTDHEISGASEIGLTQIVPAISNAVAQLIGKHLTKMPMLPQDVLRALKA